MKKLLGYLLAVIGFIASVIGIYAFVTGNQSINDLLGRTPETKVVEQASSTPAVVTSPTFTPQLLANTQPVTFTIPPTITLAPSPLIAATDTYVPLLPTATLTNTTIPTVTPNFAATQAAIYTATFSAQQTSIYSTFVAQITARFVQATRDAANSNATQAAETTRILEAIRVAATLTALAPTAPSTTTLTPRIASTNRSINNTATVNIQSANLRSGPGTNYDVIGYATLGEQFPIVAKDYDADWYLISRSQNRTAWIAASVVDVSPDNAQVQVAVTIPPTLASAPIVLTPAQDTISTRFSIGQQVRATPVQVRVRSAPSIQGSFVFLAFGTANYQGYEVLIITGSPVWGPICASTCDQNYGWWWPVRVVTRPDGSPMPYEITGWIWEGTIEANN